MATKKLSEIAAKYNFDYDDFEKFCYAASE